MKEYELQRGNKLWHQRFILPQHQEQLSREGKERERLIQPLLDEAQIEQINEKILSAYHHQHNVSVRYFNHGGEALYKGVIKNIQEHSKKIVIRTQSDEVLALSFVQILDITCD